MKAVRFHEYGDPSVLRYEDVEQPVPGAGQVLIRVAATSFNGVDGNIRAGFMQGPIPVTLPHTPGIDVSGTVAALGEGVDGFEVGDQVVGFLPMADDGAAAEYVVAPAEILAPAPTSVPLADAAALPAVGLTAWQALFDHAKLTAGQRVLINGAGGAVGGYAVQLAKNAGAYVIATASPRSGDRVKAAGADEVVDHTTTAVHRGDGPGRRRAQPRADRTGAAGRAARPDPPGRRPGEHHGVDARAQRRGARRARHRPVRPQRRAAAVAPGGADRPRRAARRGRPAGPAGRAAGRARPGCRRGAARGKTVIVAPQA